MVVFFPFFVVTRPAGKSAGTSAGTSVGTASTGALGILRCLRPFTGLDMVKGKLAEEIGGGGIKIGQWVRLIMITTHLFDLQTRVDGDDQLASVDATV